MENKPTNSSHTQQATPPAGSTALPPEAEATPGKGTDALTEAERQKMEDFLAQRNKKRHQIEVAMLIYLGICLLAVVALQALQVFCLPAQQLFLPVALVVALVYFPAWWALSKRKKNS